MIEVFYINTFGEKKYYTGCLKTYTHFNEEYRIHGGTMLVTSNCNTIPMIQSVKHNGSLLDIRALQMTFRT